MKKAKQVVTIFTITIKFNDLNTKNPSLVVTWTPGNMQSRHALWEPHTNRGGTFFCILPYLNIRDFSWLNVYFIAQYPTRDLRRRLGLLKQGVTIFTITINDLNTEKSPSPAVTWTPCRQHAVYRHAPWEPHTNRGGIFFYILPYLNISDFSWLNVYTIPL